MVEKIFINKYIPEYVPSDLKWYERDGLLTYIDQSKHEHFTKDLDGYLKKAEVVNFDIIHNQCRGTCSQSSDKHYQTVRTSDVKKMLQKERKKAVGAYLRSERKDLGVKKSSFFSFSRL